MCCCYSEESTGLGVPTLLFNNCVGLGKQHTWLSLSVLICKMRKTNPSPRLLHNVVGRAERDNRGRFTSLTAERSALNTTFLLITAKMIKLS